MKLITLLLALGLAPSFGQRLAVYSELTRIDPFGNIVPQDRGAEPRHILSPGMPRNGFSSFRIVVQLDKPGAFQLVIAQNPENAVTPTMYKEIFEKHGENWIPDRLQPVPITYDGTPADFGIPGQTTVTFWLDLFVKRTEPVDRIKVEPQLWVPAIDDWLTYPMEARILEPIFPAIKATHAKLPDPAEPADAAVLGPLREAVCGVKETPGQPMLTSRQLIRRNIIHHLALAKTKATLNGALQSLNVDVCAPSDPRSKMGPEWYLKFRDALFRN